MVAAAWWECALLSSPTSLSPADPELPVGRSSPFPPCLESF